MEFYSFVKTVEGNEGGKCNYPTRLDTYGCGCMHDCSYCYAKSLLNFRKLWNPKSPRVASFKKIREAVRSIKPGQCVRLGGMTDCFQPIEALYKVTRKTIQMLNMKRVHYLIVTKSAMVADYVKSIMYRKDVKPYWLQFPIRLFNATSHESDNWLHCWEEGGDWIREKDPISIKVNNTGTDRFHAMFPAFVKSIYPDDYQHACIVGGVRCEESPQRARGLTTQATYKEITWGKNDNGVITFYPIYDWSYTDVWHAIVSNKWKYNTVYDEFYKRGVPVAQMRVSNLHHETAVKNLDYVQEIEPKTWNKLTARLAGIHTTAEIDFDDNFKAPKELPFMFKDWREYRDYLCEHLIVDPKQREIYKKQFASDDKKVYGSEILTNALMKCHIGSMLANDYTFTKVGNFWCQHGNIYDKAKKGETIKGDNKFIREIMEEIYD